MNLNRRYFSVSGRIIVTIVCLYLCLHSSSISIPHSPYLLFHIVVFNNHTHTHTKGFQCLYCITFEYRTLLSLITFFLYKFDEFILLSFEKHPISLRVFVWMYLIFGRNKISTFAQFLLLILLGAYLIFLTCIFSCIFSNASYQLSPQISSIDWLKWYLCGKLWWHEFQKVTSQR